jgi:hypothetical protein
MSETRCYSLRRLSPYLGTVQVAEMTGARALSADGLTWQVQISNRVAGVGGRTRFSTHGIWRADGSGDLTRTEGTEPYLEVLQNLPRLPFPLVDRLELWLLDARDGLPLALLKSIVPLAKPPRPGDVRWQAAAPGDSSFVSASLAVQQAAGTVSGGGLSHSEILARFVMDAAGDAPRAQWFRREDDQSGTGQGGVGLDGVSAARRLPADAFPELLLRERWTDDAAADLVRDYHAHHSPSLLTHAPLRRETREWLEHDACRRAPELYRLRHVLPEVLNPEKLKVAMVEALIRHASAEAQPA